MKFCCREYVETAACRRIDRSGRGIRLSFSWRQGKRPAELSAFIRIPSGISQTKEEGASYAILGPGEEEGISRRVIFRMKHLRETYSYVEELKDKLAEEAPGCSAAVHDDLLQWYGIGDNRNLMLCDGFSDGSCVGLIMVGSVSSIYNAFSISLRERTRQFGLLSSVGRYEKSSWKKALNYEARSVWYFGNSAGDSFRTSGNRDYASLHRPADGQMDPWRGWGEISLKISWAAVLAAVLIAWITVKLSVWIPARGSSKFPPWKRYVPAGI